MMNKKDIKDIQEKYLKEIKIPDKKPAQQIFFCPVGLVGAGKTTVTKPISETLGLVRISSDELRKILKENGYDYSFVKKIGFKIASEFAKNGFSVSFDMDCGNLITKNFVENLAKKLHAKIFFVHIDTPEDYIIERLKRPEPLGLVNDPQIMIANYYNQKEIRLKQNTKFGFFFTFDHSRPDINKQISDCIKKIEKVISSKK